MARKSLPGTLSNDALAQSRPAIRRAETGSPIPGSRPPRRYAGLRCLFMSRVKLALLLSLLAAAGAISAVASERIAELTLRDLNGQRVRLRDYAERIVVLNFWATWCEPCAEEMPRLVSAETEYRSRGVVFIGASLDD